MISKIIHTVVITGDLKDNPYSGDYGMITKIIQTMMITVDLKDDPYSDSGDLEDNQYSTD